jgi:hypothetical protein
MTLPIPNGHLAHLYRVRDVVSGKFYIGKHGGLEQGKYWGSGLLVQRHIQKHGTSSMKYEILAIGTQQYIFDLEKAYVDDAFIKANPNCWNLAKGGRGGNLGGTPYNKGKQMSVEARKKMSIAKQGKPSPRKGATLSDETKAKIDASNKGRINSEYTLEKVKLANTGRIHKKVTCQHCNTTGGITGMARWHFNNCKLRINNV